MTLVFPVVPFASLSLPQTLGLQPLDKRQRSYPEDIGRLQTPVSSLELCIFRQIPHSKIPSTPDIENEVNLLIGPMSGTLVVEFFKLIESAILLTSRPIAPCFRINRTGVYFTLSFPQLQTDAMFFSYWMYNQAYKYTNTIIQVRVNECETE
ncbi:hypothetical protein F4779DRAFT_61436 [Xylariaceae sp. FL0662B]|nr:hypothetical protein F4779DRAFT_61436 [Xylariaceae sp. FL0662B]